jgi:hypothetical protein
MLFSDPVPDPDPTFQVILDPAKMFIPEITTRYDLL